MSETKQQSLVSIQTTFLFVVTIPANCHKGYSVKSSDNIVLIEKTKIESIFIFMKQTDIHSSINLQENEIRTKCFFFFYEDIVGLGHCCDCLTAVCIKYCA